jgi:hypothetical protein
MQDMLQPVCWKVLEHLPYSLGKSLCDFHVPGLFKKVLKGCRFKSNKDVKDMVVQRSQHQPREFSVEEIHQLMWQWDACLNVNGDYF